ncbi:MAG: mannitol dehydrogenase family protein [Thalassovita sp.]
MNQPTLPQVHATVYDRDACNIGVVHIGYGAFHRAHQAVYFDDYMDQTGDLRWGIAAVNLRSADSVGFARNRSATNGYVVKSVSPSGEIGLRNVRSHLGFFDWSNDQAATEALLTNPNVHLVTITVTESGYYGDASGTLDPADEAIDAELSGGPKSSIYAYLAAALTQRQREIDQPLSILCCDNIQHNGSKLRKNLMAYLHLAGQSELAEWVNQKVTFPCSMVDRITPRSSPEVQSQIEAMVGEQPVPAVMAETFTQWVLERDFAGPVPALEKVGVTITDDVDPYEDAKLRILNGGHTCLTYLAALHNVETFDQAMRVPELAAHFDRYETDEVLVGLTTDLPFDKAAYLTEIAARFRNQAIGDTVARICADGMAKFPIFIRPTLASCLAQGVMPAHGIKSIASWYVFAKHVEAGRVPFDYVEPSWSELAQLLSDPTRDRFVKSEKLWGDLPETYPDFAQQLRTSIEEMELSWPV